MQPVSGRAARQDRHLSALAHPLRRRLLTVLEAEGAATVSTLAHRTGQRVGNVSHHVRVLATAGLVREDPLLARDRRERWWRLPPVDDTVVSLEVPLRLAPHEMQQVAAEVEAVLARWQGREEPDDGHRRLPVRFSAGIQPAPS